MLPKRALAIAVIAMLLSLHLLTAAHAAAAQPITEIFWRNTTTGAVAIWTMNGITKTGSANLDSAPLSWQISGIGDLTNDAIPDILWRNAADGMAAAWTTYGTSLTGFSYVDSAPLTWKIVGVADFDGDGNSDILWQNTGTGEIVIWFMNGLQTAGFATVGSAPLEWIVVGVGDFNSDNSPDILWQNTNTGLLAVWLMNGAVPIGYDTIDSSPAGWKVAGVGDFSADGNPDILWRNTVTGAVAVWYLNGVMLAGSAVIATETLEWEIGGVYSGTPFTSPPAGVKAFRGNGQVTVTWDPSAGATSYNLYWAVTSGVRKTSGTKIPNVTSPFTHSPLDNGMTYYYVVTAVNGGGESADSIEFSATPRLTTPYTIPDTGQTEIYAAGDDGSYSIHAPSYTDNGNGTITDNNTGLLWQQQPDTATGISWYGADSYCAGLVLGGQTDWRLPTWMELITIVYYTSYNFRINSAFFLNTPGYEWTETAYAPNTSLAWCFDFTKGNTIFLSKGGSYFTPRCVRGTPLSPPVLSDHGDGTITDSATGLMWQKQDDATARTWTGALDYCEGLSLSSYTDWRLPNIKELTSIVDDSRSSPSIDPVFTNTAAGGYWSSTTYLGSGFLYGTDYAHLVHFAIGNTLGGDSGGSINQHRFDGPKTGLNYVRCVRGQ